MTVMMIQAKVSDECVAEVESAVQTMFSAIDEVGPQGVRYASTKLTDGVTFVIFLALEGDQNPLMAIPAFGEFQQSLPGWLVEPVAPQPLTVVGSYNLF